MLILGILLIAAAAVVFGYLLFGTRDLSPLEIDLGIFTVQLTPLHLYLLGAATLVVLVLGLLALVIGIRSSRRKRREVKELRKAVEHNGGAGQHTDSTARPPRDVHPQSRGGERQVESGGYEREVPSGRPASPAADPAQQRNAPGVALPSDYPNAHPDRSSPNDPPGGARG